MRLLFSCRVSLQDLEPFIQPLMEKLGAKLQSQDIKVQKKARSRVWHDAPAWSGTALLVRRSPSSPSSPDRPIQGSTFFSDCHLCHWMNRNWCCKYVLRFGISRHQIMEHLRDRWKGFLRRGIHFSISFGGHYYAFLATLRGR